MSYADSSGIDKGSQMRLRNIYEDWTAVMDVLIDADEFCSVDLDCENTPIEVLSRNFKRSALSGALASDAKSTRTVPILSMNGLGNPRLLRSCGSTSKIVTSCPVATEHTSTTMTTGTAANTATNNAILPAKLSRR